MYRMPLNMPFLLVRHPGLPKSLTQARQRVSPPRRSASTLEHKACFSEFQRDQSTNRSPLLEKMGQEIPTYFTLLQSVDVSVFDHDKPPEFTAAVLDWWRGNCTQIPNWAVAARIMFAIPPSSAAAERIFSILGNSFDPTRQTALQDLVEGTLMVRFNSIQREKESRNEQRGLEAGV